MPDVKPIAPVRIGHTDIMYAQGMRAGSWLFFTGHEATDFENGIATNVMGNPGCRSAVRLAICARENLSSIDWPS